MVKLLFGKDADKFEIAGTYDITRTNIYAGEMGMSYNDFMLTLF